MPRRRHLQYVVVSGRRAIVQSSWVVELPRTPPHAARKLTFRDVSSLDVDVEAASCARCIEEAFFITLTRSCLPEWRVRSEKVESSLVAAGTRIITPVPFLVCIPVFFFSLGIDRVSELQLTF